MSFELVLIAFAAFIVVKLGVEIYGRLNPPENLSLENFSGKKLAKDDSILLVDIRTPSEWKETGVIKGAQLVTFTTVGSFLDEVRPKLSEGQKLALICRSGNRSSRAARKVAKQVNWPIMDIEGGMSRIVSEGYRTIKPSIQ